MKIWEKRLIRKIDNPDIGVLEVTNKLGISFAVLYDKRDEDIIETYNWYVESSYSNIVISNPGLLLSRTLLKVTDPSLVVDHINGNPLDNRRCNLRICTQSENSANKKMYNNKSSVYKGVSWYKTYNKWRCSIGFKRQLIFIGYYDNEEDAAKAYDEKAKELFGEYALLNFSE